MGKPRLVAVGLGLFIVLFCPPLAVSPLHAEEKEADFMGKPLKAIPPLTRGGANQPWVKNPHYAAPLEALFDAEYTPKTANGESRRKKGPIT